MSAREAALIDMGLNPDDFAESKIDPALFTYAPWPNDYKDAKYPCVPCAMCGHMCQWIVGFTHIPSGEVIYVGETCSNYLDTENIVEKQMKQFKTKVANQKIKDEQHAKFMERRAEMVAHDLDVCDFLAATEAQETAYREAEKPTTIKAPMPFMNEMVHSFNKWGSLTENQINAVRKIMVAQAEYEAKKAAEKQPEQPLLGGKRLLEGEVTNIKLKQDDYYGGASWKMLVTLLDGNKVYGSIPKSIRAAVENMRDLRGQRVSLLANVIVSNNDENFGWFKNPSQGVVER